MPMDMPPMDMSQDMGNDMGGDFMPQGDMSGDMGIPMDDGMNGGQSEFDTNFDAGVDADEDQDPKKYIQQLTGKLSQTLQKYTTDNGQPDVDLNKYVAGMIVKQAMKGLSEQDAEEIINKVQSDEDFSMEDDGGMGNMEGDMMQGQDQQMMGGDMQQGQDMMPPQQDDMQQQNGMPQMNESFSRFKRRNQIKEIVNGVLKQKDSEENISQKPKNVKGYRTSAYTTPKFS